MIVLAVMVVIGVIGGIYYFWAKSAKVLPTQNITYPFATPTTTPLKQTESSSLNSSSSSLDTTDFAQMDAELNKLNSDSLSF